MRSNASSSLSRKIFPRRCSRVCVSFQNCSIVANQDDPFYDAETYMV